MLCSGPNKINIYVGTTLTQSSSRGAAVMTVLTSSSAGKKIFTLTVCFSGRRSSACPLRSPRQPRALPARSCRRQTPRPACSPAHLSAASRGSCQAGRAVKKIGKGNTRRHGRANSLSAALRVQIPPEEFRGGKKFTDVLYLCIHPRNERDEHGVSMERARTGTSGPATGRRWADGEIGHRSPSAPGHGGGLENRTWL